MYESANKLEKKVQRATATPADPHLSNGHGYRTCLLTAWGAITTNTLANTSSNKLKHTHRKHNESQHFSPVAVSCSSGSLREWNQQPPLPTLQLHEISKHTRDNIVGFIKLRRPFAFLLTTSQTSGSLITQNLTWRLDIFEHFRLFGFENGMFDKIDCWCTLNFIFDWAYFRPSNPPF